MVACEVQLLEAVIDAVSAQPHRRQVARQTFGGHVGGGRQVFHHQHLHCRQQGHPPRHCCTATEECVMLPKAPPEAGMCTVTEDCHHHQAGAGHELLVFEQCPSDPDSHLSHVDGPDHELRLIHR